MTAAKTSKAAASKSKAAAEKNGAGPKTVDFRGLELQLPVMPPGSLYFKLGRLERDQGSAAAQLEILELFIGPEQVLAVEAKVDEQGISFAEIEDVLVDLFNDMMDAYGTSPGESEASPES